MQVTLDIPEEMARLLGADRAVLTKAAMVGLALEGLRSGKITVAQARRFLGISSRYERDGFLKAHDVLLPLPVVDLEREVSLLGALGK